MKGRPAFALGSGGCGCSSCSHTSEFSAKGFGAWPRGNPAGRKAATEYASHVSYGKAGGVQRAIPAFTLSPEPQFSRLPGLVMPITQNMEAVRWNMAQQKSKRPDKPASARPPQGSSPAAHFSEQDRPLQTAVIYAMPNSQIKRPVGRPQIGKRRLIVLDEESAKQARELGNGNLSAGIRHALKACQAPRRARS